jgi:hypothetical protein
MKYPLLAKFLQLFLDSLSEKGLFCDEFDFGFDLAALKYG